MTTYHYHRPTLFFLRLQCHTEAYCEAWGCHKHWKPLKSELFISLPCHVFYVTTLAVGTTSGRLHCPVKWPLVNWCHEACHCLPLPSGSHLLKYEICLSRGSLSRHYCRDFGKYVVIWNVFVLKFWVVFKISKQNCSFALLLYLHTNILLFVYGESCLLKN